MVDVSFLQHEQKENLVGLDIAEAEAEAEASAAPNRVSFKRQLFSSCSAIISSVSFGMTTAFTGTFLAHLKQAEWFSKHQDMESWTAGIVCLSMVVGVLISAHLMRRYGRKPCLLLPHPFWVCGWLLLSYAYDIRTLLTACFLVGLAAGVFSAVSILYVAEISEARSRGVLLNLIGLGVSFGILVAHSLGILLPWSICCAVSAVVPCTAFAFALFTPESPTWLVLRRRTEHAKKVFLWLRNHSAKSEEEFGDVLLSSTNACASQQHRWGIFEKRMRKPLLLSALLFTVQQGSGTNVMVFHAIGLLSVQGQGPQGADNLIIIVDTVRFIASLVSSGVIKLVSRRTLYFCSAAGVSLCLAAIILATVLRFSTSSTVLLVFFSGYICFLYVGFVQIPWIMSGELYPMAARELGSTICNCMAFFLAFVVVKTAPFLLKSFGLAVTFAIYLGIVMAGTIILYFYMPETNNLALEKIEDNFRDTRT